MICISTKAFIPPTEVTNVYFMRRSKKSNHKASSARVISNWQAVASALEVVPNINLIALEPGTLSFREQYKVVIVTLVSSSTSSEIYAKVRIKDSTFCVDSGATFATA